MITFTATLTTTAMIMVALLMGKLHATSDCALRRWQAEVKRVGETLKETPSWSWSPACQGPRVTWAFKGKLHASR